MTMKDLIVIFGVVLITNAGSWEPQEQVSAETKEMNSEEARNSVF